jgi:hypothetical protein
MFRVQLRAFVEEIDAQHVRVIHANRLAAGSSFSSMRTLEISGRNPELLSGELTRANFVAWIRRLQAAGVSVELN